MLTFCIYADFTVFMETHKCMYYCLQCCLVLCYILKCAFSITDKFLAINNYL